MNVRPIGAQVLVKLLPKDKITSGGIVIPDNVDDRHGKEALVGEVVGVGAGYRLSVTGDTETLLPERIPLDVHKGDRILFPPNVGEEVTIDGEKLQLIHEEIVLAIIEDENDPSAVARFASW